MKKKVKKEAKGLKEEKKVQWSPKMFIFTLLHYFTRHMQCVKVIYLPVLTESNVKDFCFLMTGISENVLATSNEFPKPSECWQTYLNTFQWLLNVLKTPTSLSTICLKIFSKYLIWMLFKDCTIWNWNLEKPN